MEINHKLVTHGLKCDNCDWKDETIPAYEWKNCVNTACPTCGANILTQEDYDEAIGALEMFHFISNINEDDLNKMMQEMTPEKFELIKAHLIEVGVQGLENITYENIEDDITISSEVVNGESNLVVKLIDKE
jgi:hypothetical protein